jgi:ribosomal protein S21
MSVVVHKDMSIDLALRLLWREAMREGIIETLQERRYYISPSEKRHAKKKVWMKAKKIRRKLRRRNRGKVYSGF